MTEVLEEIFSSGWVDVNDGYDDDDNDGNDGLMLTTVIMVMAMKAKILELFKAALDEIGTTSHLFRFLSPKKKRIFIWE